MMCCYCEEKARRHGRDRKGNQRFKCRGCKRTFLEDRPRLLGDMRIDHGVAVMALKMLAEGCSIRSIERLTGLHRDTVCRLLVLVGSRVKKLMEAKIQNVPVRDVQADEIWSYVGCKQKTKHRKRIDDPYVGDAWGFVGMERNTKLILAWHLGKRTRPDAMQFLERLHWVTANRFQLSTDGWAGYRDTVHHCLGAKADFAMVEKKYATPARDEARYSPPVVVGVKRTRMYGRPDSRRVCTSHVERGNLTIRTFIKRYARLTISFSRKWENHEAALAWFFCFYNFCRVHGSLRVTPAMESRLTDHIWTVEEVLEAAATHC